MQLADVSREDLQLEESEEVRGLRLLLFFPRCTVGGARF